MRAGGVSESEDEAVTLIAQAKEGSNSSLGKLLATCRGYLLLVANQQVDDDLRAKLAPSDLVQETFLLAQKKFATFEGLNEHELRGWLRQILINRYRDLWREYKETKQRASDREVSIEADGSGHGMHALLAATADTPSAQAVAKEDLATLEEALNTLTDEQRRIVELRNWDRLSFVDIGERLGKSEDAVRKTWGRAMKQLVDRWGSTDDAE